MWFMRDFQKSKGHWWRAGSFWPLALLPLTNCGFSTGGLPGDNAFDPGTAPQSSAIMCDIPKLPIGDCATPSDLPPAGVPMAKAAIILAEGPSATSIGLDYSPSATQGCNGLPKKTSFQGPFPDGLTLCLNCEQVIGSGKTFATPTDACVAKCVDLINASDFPGPPESVYGFCLANARPSTNFFTCLAKACSVGGSPISPFDDPRRAPEPVIWTDFGGQAARFGNSLSKVTGVPGNFDSGAASDLTQNITHGDAWVEFSASENGVSHVLGVSTSNGTADTDPTLTDIQLAINLSSDNQVYVLEEGGVAGPFFAYSPGDRFRIHITDNNDYPHTATISYAKVIGACPPGTKCTETTFAQSTILNAPYPFRIDASFNEPGATLSNVTLMRIKDKQ
jgi:hypothetical protein